MLLSQSPRVGYVLKRYPRYSETFIVNEILAHEAQGLKIEIFALRPPEDTHFQNIISQVRARVHYIRKPVQGRTSEFLTSLAPTAASYFWAELQEASQLIPDLWAKLSVAQGERASTVYQALWLAREIKLQNITHLHAHFGTVATSVARLAAHFTGIPYTFTAHAKDIFHESVDKQDLTGKLSDAATVVTVSDYNLRYLQANYGIAANRVRRIYNGLDLSQLSYKSPLNRTPLILFVGRLIEKKGGLILIEACAQLRDWDCEFHCQIIGTGSCQRQLIERIKELNLGLQVEIVGPRPQNEVFAALQQAAAFAAPYVVGTDGNRDGLPTVLLEAMALGTPCVATDVTGIPEIVRDGETGLLVPQHDVKALAIALKQLLNNGTQREQLAREARKLIEEAFDIHCNSAVLRSLFQPISTTQKVLQEV
ncbi:glycosyltransferase [Merismopedia glauca]|uniref:Colanic acid biosynthesis glycosyltransferase WcaL n=1 Tax=Merismopedia glauca CCAP 1448/3 TaxID=1296344 RepID=A0A2T1CAE6_9CYAN|nr:glycosyltransferase [Merismopedia glauca]PSB05113.1 colanic acid biosynthesis glycosyltransferase WcaL [Merismopedia glauca CCAP 1448/3]